MAAWNRIAVQGKPGMVPDAPGKRYVVHSPMTNSGSFVGMAHPSTRLRGTASPTSSSAAPRQPRATAVAGGPRSPPGRVAGVGPAPGAPHGAAPLRTVQLQSSPSMVRSPPPPSARTSAGPSPQRTSSSGRISVPEREIHAAKEVAAFSKEHSSPSLARALPPQSPRASAGPSPQRTSSSGRISVPEREIHAAKEVAAFSKEHSSPSVARTLPPQSPRASSGPSHQRASSRGRISVPELEINVGNEVTAFLKEQGLGKHTAVFLQSGVDDMETLLALDDRDMQDLGLPVFHRQRLCRRLDELRSQAQPETQATHPVGQFLQDAGLGQYARVLIRNGFDELETLMEIEDSDLKDLGMPRGHILKLRKRLREFAAEHGIGDGVLHKVSERRTTAQVANPQPKADPVLASSSRTIPVGHMKTAVEQSWERVQALGPMVLGDLLYQHTLSLAPAAVALFPYEVRVKYLDWSSVDDESDVFNSPAMRRLFARIVNAVGSCVMGLADPITMVPWLLHLGGRHVGFGASEPQWQVVLEALHLTLHDALGAAYTPDVQEAWKQMGTFIAQIMIEGLRRAQEAATREHQDAAVVSCTASTQSGSMEEESDQGCSEDSEGGDSPHPRSL